MLSARHVQARSTGKPTHSIWQTDKCKGMGSVACRGNLKNVAKHRERAALGGGNSKLITKDSKAVPMESHSEMSRELALNTAG